MTIRVGVLGAAGKMGATVCRAIADDPDTDLVCAVDPGRPDGTVCGVSVSASLDALVAAEADVAVDFTRPDTVRDNVRFCLSRGIHAVVGTTGLADDDLSQIASWTGRANCVVAPNFSVGAVLMMHLSEQAARYFGSCEVVEAHHNQKLDAPSGTAWRTARRVAEVWASVGRPAGGEPAEGEEEKVGGARGGDVGGVRVHSLRLQGAEAHQEVVFGGPGQMLTIRHDATDRSSYMPGVLLAVKQVADRPGLTVGLEHLLGL